MRLIALLQFSLRGNVFIYQGEELGLTQADIPVRALQDPEAFTNWPHTLGRDGARTPMPWRERPTRVRLLDGEPWLPVEPRTSRWPSMCRSKTRIRPLNFFRTTDRLRKVAGAALR